MLSINDVKELGRIARVSLGEDEAESLCNDLNALLELSAVLEELPEAEFTSDSVATLKDLRADSAFADPTFADAGKGFSVPPVMEKT